MTVLTKAAIDKLNKDGEEIAGRHDGKPRKWNRKGEPIGLGDWAALYEDPVYPKIVTTELPNGVLITTVWQGVSVRIRLGKPAIFETFVFYGGDSESADVYITEDAARAGHATICEAWANGPPSD